MKRIIITIGVFLLLIIVLVIVKLLLVNFFQQLEGNKILSFILYFVFVLGSILIIKYYLKNKE